VACERVKPTYNQLSITKLVNSASVDHDKTIVVIRRCWRSSPSPEIWHSVGSTNKTDSESPHQRDGGGEGGRRNVS